jgi:predicted  nucleic acid-binding Zn-ribbon protein
MSNIAERYTSLCRAYVKLSDRFQQLDVEHMTLKTKVVPLLKSLKTHKAAVERLQKENGQLIQDLQVLTVKHTEEMKPLEQENQALRQELQVVTAKYETLQPLEQENQALRQELQVVTAKYETLQPFESLLQPDMQAALAEAEEQILLVDETIEEIDQNGDPDLNPAEQQLLAEYWVAPDLFEISEVVASNGVADRPLVGVAR